MYMFCSVSQTIYTRVCNINICTYFYFFIKYFFIIFQFTLYFSSCCNCCRFIAILQIDYLHSYACKYMQNMVQLNLNLTEHACSKGTAHFSFHTRASLPMHARLMTSNLLCKALMYALHVCTMHMCMSGMHMPNLDYTCMQIVSQRQRNKLYKHVYVLRCNPPRNTRHKSC